MRRIKWYSIPIILMIFIFGCSNNTSEDTTDDSDNTIKIGVILPFSGESSAYGSSEMQGIQMAVDEINDAGGVLGKTIELVVCDSRSDPFQASLLYVDDDYGQEISQTFKNRFDYYGTVEKMVSYQTGKVSYTAEIESLFAGVDTSDSSQRTVFLIAYPRSGAQIIRDWKASGYSANWILSDELKAQEFITSAGAENVEGLMGVSPYNGDIDYEYFKDDYEDFTGQDPRKHRGIENWYDAMILLGYAILYADTTDPYLVGKALQIVSSPPVVGTLVVRGDINYEGVSGSVNMNNDGDIEDARYELWEIEDGQFVHIEELRP